jgi:flagellar biosynthesis protein FlhF
MDTSSTDDLRTFQAKSIQEAIAIVRKELGPEASVLHTRKLPSGVLSWLLNSPRFEVTASATIQAPSRFASSFEAIIGDDLPSDSDLVEEPEDATNDNAEPEEPEFDREPLKTWAPSHIESRLTDRRSFRGSLEPSKKSIYRKHTTGESREFAAYSKLLDLGFEETLAKSVAREAASQTDDDEPDALLNSAAYLTAEQVNIADPWEFARGKCHRIALVGPTGVGKTTTIAKLAADLRLRQRRRVGLITVDTYRIAAVDQLQTYASIIELPCEVASSPEEMQAALKKLGDCEVIFLDTAGRGPFDSLRMLELTRILRAFQADEVHLALSATSRVPLLDTLLDKFECARPTHLTLTKLDECDGIGPLAQWLTRNTLPLRFLTTGQDVPQDYAAPTLELLAEAFLGRS